jgi:hypothetical protein
LRTVSAGPRTTATVNRLDITILTVAALAALGSLAAARRWPFGVRLHRVWQRLEPYAGQYVRRSPATFTYAAVIAVTTWVVAGLNPRVSEELLRAQSTNLDNLRTHPLDVLFRSMFFSGSASVLPFVALIAAVLAPAEVWLGTARLIFVFVVGHVGATLITALARSARATSRRPATAGSTGRSTSASATGSSASRPCWSTACRGRCGFRTR